MEHEEIVLNVLKSWDKKEKGWWYGHSQLEDETEIGGKANMIALRTLKKKGIVKTEPIFCEETGMLNGSGWFLTGVSLRV